MDDYYLGLEDREGLIELGVGVNDGEALLKLIPGAVKSSLTREYNKRDHPIAFANQGATKVAKKLAGDAAPDTEDVQVSGCAVCRCAKQVTDSGLSLHSSTRQKSSRATMTTMTKRSTSRRTA